MNDIPRQTLKQIVRQYGPQVCDNPRRCEALLRDLCGEHRREIFVLVSALEHDVVDDLRTLTAQLPFSVILPRLAAELHETTALSEEAARWAIAVWAEALGLASDADIANATTISLPPNASIQNEPTSGFRLIHRWEAHEGEITDLAFSPDGRQLASVGMDAAARIWNVAGAQAKIALQQQTGILTSVAWRPDGLALALGSGDMGIYFWHWTDTGGDIPRLRGHHGEVTAVLFLPDGGPLVSSSQDGTMHLWDVDAGAVTGTLRGHTEGVLDVAASPDGRTLISAGGWDRTVRVWDVAQQQELWSLGGHTAQVTCVDFAPQGNLAASGSWDETIRLWNPLRGVSVASLVAQEEVARLTTDIAFDRQNETLAAGDWNGDVRLWHVHRRRLLGTLSEHKTSVRRVAFSPTGRWLASADDQGILCLWRHLRAGSPPK